MSQVAQLFGWEGPSAITNLGQLGQTKCFKNGPNGPVQAVGPSTGHYSGPDVPEIANISKQVSKIKTSGIKAVELATHADRSRVSQTGHLRSHFLYWVLFHPEAMDIGWV